jgi:hypothetical protein
VPARVMVVGAMMRASGEIRWKESTRLIPSASSRHAVVEPLIGDACLADQTWLDG